MKRVLLISLTVLASGLFLTQTGFSYPTWNNGGQGGCNNCHPTTPGTGVHTLDGTAHQTCSNCHPGGNTSIPPVPSACIVCHPPANPGQCDLINNSLAGAFHGQTCLTCHSTCEPSNTTTTTPVVTTTTVPANTTTTTPENTTTTVLPTNSCAITIEPESAVVNPGDNKQFAELSGPVGSQCEVPCYQWNVTGESGASITQDGLYTAGDKTGIDMVTLTDTCNNVSATATITVIDQQIDTDGDGVPDTVDNCPESNLEKTMTIGRCDSGVTNQVFEDGCTMSDLIANCASGAKRHGRLAICVTNLTNNWKDRGFISEQENDAIKSCIAKFYKSRNGKKDDKNKGKGKGKSEDGEDDDEDNDTD